MSIDSQSISNSNVLVQGVERQLEDLLQRNSKLQKVINVLFDQLSQPQQNILFTKIRSIVSQQMNINNFESYDELMSLLENSKSDIDERFYFNGKPEQNIRNLRLIENVISQQMRQNHQENYDSLKINIEVTRESLITYDQTQNIIAKLDSHLKGFIQASIDYGSIYKEQINLLSKSFDMSNIKREFKCCVQKLEDQLKKIQNQNDQTKLKLDNILSDSLEQEKFYLNMISEQATFSETCVANYLLSIKEFQQFSKELHHQTKILIQL